VASEKQQESSFSEEKEAKRLLCLGAASADWPMGKIGLRFQAVKFRSAAGQHQE
jgi:hypothetical protein